MQIIDGSHWLTVIPNDDVAFLKGSPLRRAVRLNGDDQDPALDRQVVEAHNATMQGNVLPSHADVTAPDLAVLDEASGDELRRINPYGEADALRRQDHRRIYADDIPARRDQRTPRVAWVERGVGLDNVVDEPAGPGAKQRSDRKSVV